MLAIQLRSAIEVAPRTSLTAIGETLWKAWGQGLVTDAEAQGLAEYIQARRVALQGPETDPGSPSARSPGQPTIFPPKRRQRASNRALTRERCRHHARARWMPDHLADQFTDGEVAVLSVIAEEYQTKGYCDLPRQQIAALAGVSETTANNAVRAARDHGLIVVEERPQRGGPHLPSIVRIVSREWRSWVERRPASWRRGGGCSNLRTTQKKEILPLYPLHDGAQGNGLKGYRRKRAEPGGTMTA